MRAQWIRLKGVPGDDVAMLNVYAPHSSPERSALWSELLKSKLGDCRWIITRDWNFVERHHDKTNLIGSVL